MSVSVVPHLRQALMAPAGHRMIDAKDWVFDGFIRSAPLILRTGTGRGSWQANAQVPDQTSALDRRRRIDAGCIALVDTGAELTWLPAEVLESLGIERDRWRASICASSPRTNASSTLVRRPLPAPPHNRVRPEGRGKSLDPRRPATKQGK